MRVSKGDQISFAKRLAMILRSGMPIMEGLHMLKDESHSRSSTFVYERLIASVSEGQPLSRGLTEFQQFFGDFAINIVRVGEASGTLHENLEYLAEELKRKQALKRKVVGALIYPALIMVATTGIVIMLTVFIFPKILPIFQSVKATLPWSTRSLIAISNFLGAHGITLALTLLALAVGSVTGMRLVPAFHLFVDRSILRIPLLGRLSQYYNVANISRTLSLLLKSDVRIVQAIELVADSTTNLSYRTELYAARERIIKGQKIATQFREKPNLFPPLMGQMIAVGESTGNLSGTLEYISAMYEEDINELTKNLTTLIEPILMIVMGLVVGFIAVSIITPIYSITSNLSPR
jgi:type II secretory pathway component PulF